MAAFYRQFGWLEAPTSVPEHVVFQCSNGVVLGLFSEPDFEARFGPAGDTRRGIALTIHVDDEQAVNRAHADVSGFDDVLDLDAQPTRSGWGYGFGFAIRKETCGASPSSSALGSMHAAGSSTPDPMWTESTIFTSL